MPAPHFHLIATLALCAAGAVILGIIFVLARGPVADPREREWRRRQFEAPRPLPHARPPTVGGHHEHPPGAFTA